MPEYNKYHAACLCVRNIRYNSGHTAGTGRL